MQQAGFSSAKNMGKERLETVFRLFWDFGDGKNKNNEN